MTAGKGPCGLLCSREPPPHRGPAGCAQESPCLGVGVLHAQTFRGTPVPPLSGQGGRCCGDAEGVGTHGPGAPAPLTAVEKSPVSACRPARKGSEPRLWLGHSFRAGTMGWGGRPVAGSRRQGSLRPQAPGIQKPGLLTWAQRTRPDRARCWFASGIPMTVTYEPRPCPACSHTASRPASRSLRTTHLAMPCLSVAARPVATLPRSWEKA